MTSVHPVLFFLIAACTASAQSVEPLKTKALTFGFDGLSLSRPHGADVGGKIWLQDNRALGLGLFGHAFRQTQGYADTTATDFVTTGYGIGIRTAIEQHADLNGRLSPYILGATSLSLSYSRIHMRDTPSSYSYRQREFSLELSGGAGLEWWFARRLSLTGQQLITATLDFRNQTLSDSFKQDTRIFSMGIGTSSLMLNVYL